MATNLFSTFTFAIIFSIFVATSVNSIKAEQVVNMANETHSNQDLVDKSSMENTEGSQSIESIAVDGIMNFTLQLQHILLHLSSYDGNVLFAPVNIASTLTTLLLGADGDTKAEILKVIGLVSGKNLINKEENIHHALGKLFDKFATEHENNTAIKILVGNAIFTQNNIEIEKEFLNQAEKIYKNEIKTVDFSAPADSAAKIINEWASSHTNGKINEIIQPPIMHNTELIIASTLFFNGEWEQPFFANSSWEHFFTDEGIVQAKMMANRASAYVYDNPNKKFSVLGLPYKGKEVLMYLLLPYRDQPLKDILANITSKDIADIVEKAAVEDEVTYFVPYLDLTENINVETALNHAGIKTIFDPSKANLTKIAKGVHVSDAIHKVNLHLTEAGSTGSAATTLNIETRFPDKHMFNFNKPFAFYVYHKSTGLISFWGTINMPVPHHKL